MVVSWLLNSVDHNIVDSLMYMSTAHEIWADLRQISSEQYSRIYQIKKMLSELQQGAMDVNSYYTKLRILWDELRDYQPTSVCNCVSMKELMSYHNQECLMHFLMGLNDSYAHVCAQILMIEPLPGIAKVFSLVIQEERQRSINLTVSKMSVGQSSGANSVKSSFTPAANTSIKSSQNVQGKKSDMIVCSHCHYTDHMVDKCFKLHGYPPGTS